MTAEHDRLKESFQQQTSWKKWDPYLSERQWGTVREDYRASGRFLFTVENRGLAPCS